MQTLMDFVPVLRDGCEHMSKGFMCADCMSACADTIEKLRDLMTQTANAEYNIRLLMSSASPFEIVHLEPLDPSDG